jgi:hypothetical protein
VAEASGDAVSYGKVVVQQQVIGDPSSPPLPAPSPTVYPVQVGQMEIMSYVRY